MRSALEAFSAKGFEGTSIADIASKAHVRKSLVQYHFGSKEQLWNACIEEQAHPLLGAIDSLLQGEADAAELLTARFRLLRDNSEVRRLIAWACLDPAPIPGFLMDRRDRIKERLGGDFTDLASARLLFVLAATDGWFLFRDLYSRLFGPEILGEQVESELLRLISEVAPNLE